MYGVHLDMGFDHGTNSRGVWESVFKLDDPTFVFPLLHLFREPRPFGHGCRKCPEGGDTETVDTCTVAPKQQIGESKAGVQLAIQPDFCHWLSVQHTSTLGSTNI